MAGKGPEEYFDTQRFLNDVWDYGKRHFLSKSSVLLAAGVDRNYIAFWNKRQTITLRMACRLADLADLSLDDYRINKEFG